MDKFCVNKQLLLSAGAVLVLVTSVFYLGNGTFNYKSSAEVMNTGNLGNNIIFEYNSIMNFWLREVINKHHLRVTPTPPSGKNELKRTATAAPGMSGYYTDPKDFADVLEHAPSEYSNYEFIVELDFVSHYNSTTDSCFLGRSSYFENGLGEIFPSVIRHRLFYSFPLANKDMKLYFFKDQEDGGRVSILLSSWKTDENDVRSLNKLTEFSKDVVTTAFHLEADANGDGKIKDSEIKYSNWANTNNYDEICGRDLKENAQRWADRLLEESLRIDENGEFYITLLYEAPTPTPFPEDEP